MLSAGSSGKFTIDAIKIHSRIIRSAFLFRNDHNGALLNNPPGILFCKGLDLLRILKETLLICNDLLDAIGQLFPMLFRQIKIGAEVQDGRLARTTFCSNRIDQFVGAMFSTVFLVFVLNGANKHVE